MGIGTSCCVDNLVSHNANEEIDDDDDGGEVEGEVHILICGIDYTGDQNWAGQNPLDTRYAFDIMKDLAEKSGAETVRSLWNQEVTNENVLAAIQGVGGRCNEGDYFIFYYTGHGDRLEDDDGDEASGKDSALCFLGPDGNVEPREEVWMRDDVLADNIMSAVKPSVKVLVLADCCHSGTVMDFKTNPEWSETEQIAISISGCEDAGTSAGTGKGGLFTRSLSAAIQSLQEDGEEGYMVSKVYNRTLQEYGERKFEGHTQNITIHGCMLRPSEMPWPLVPTEPYVSPANSYMHRGMGS